MRALMVSGPEFAQRTAAVPRFLHKPTAGHIHARAHTCTASHDGCYVICFPSHSCIGSAHLQGTPPLPKRWVSDPRALLVFYLMFMDKMPQVMV